MSDVEIERIKLKATFYNNVAVGLLLGGILIPYLAIVTHFADITTRLMHWSFTQTDMLAVVAYVVALFLVYFGFRKMRRRADDEVQKIVYFEKISK